MKLTALSALLIGFGALQAAAQEKTVEQPDSTGFIFSDINIVKTTPVKDQNKSGTCWSFSGISFLEDEILNKTGKEVDLSEMFVVRKCYEAKADKYVRMHGECNLAGGGSIPDAIWVWNTYGMMPESAYPGISYGEEKHVHGELDAGLKAYLDVIVSNPNKRLSTVWRDCTGGILDAYLGQVPETFEADGRKYSPRSYADSFRLDMNDYKGYVSYSHRPFGEMMVLDVPDNWLNGQYMNVPIDKLKEIVDKSLAAGHSVLWAADVSEGGFKWRKGYAVLPKGKSEGDMEGSELARWVTLSDKERQDAKYDISGPVEEETVTQQSRQLGYDRYETTDDHGMVIVGTAVDQLGNPYYKVKNSWDTNQIYGGYIYVSVPYFLAKTIGIVVNDKAVK